MQPNFLAPLALALYPLFVCALFWMRRPPVAVALAFVVAELVLPVGYLLPLSYPTWLGKITIPPLASLFCAVTFGRAYLRRSSPFRGVDMFFVIGVVGSFLTMYTNRDALFYGPTILKGEDFRDFVSDTIRSVMIPWTAFYLGRCMFRSSRDLLALFRIMIIAATIYTLPILIEIRMSPQFSRWIYGYAPFDDFFQAIRWGGFRPSVLMGHGLGLSLFMVVCTLMAAAVVHAKKRIGTLPPLGVCLYLALVVVLCKSTGSILYEVALLPFVFLASPKRVARVAMVLVVIIIAYPVLRFADLLPVNQLSSMFSSISADRADSLSYRFNMEQGVLDLARTHPWFGMGGYGRNFVFDPMSGRQVTVLDGEIIGRIGSHGLVGFATFFGPLLYSVWRSARLVKRLKSKANQVMISTLAITCAVMLLDLIINSTLPPVFLLIIGALCGAAPALVREEEQLARPSSAGPQQMPPEYHNPRPPPVTQGF